MEMLVSVYNTSVHDVLDILKYRMQLASSVDVKITYK